jgi:hypothetical protein
MQYYFDCVIARGAKADERFRLSATKKKKCFYNINASLFNVIAARDNVASIMRVASRQQNWVLLTRKAGKKNDRALYIRESLRRHYV